MKKTAFFFILISVIITITLLASCSKDPTTVGFEVQPPSDQMNVEGNDSLIFFASYTVLRDSMITSNLSQFVLGELNDPVFGKSHAAFNTQLRLESVNHSFGSNVQLDSICLQLAYKGSWGDPKTVFTVHVHQLLDSLWINSDTTAAHFRVGYYSSDPITYNETALGSKTFLPKPSDSVTVITPHDTVAYAPFLSIKLDNSFGEALLADSSFFVSNETFLRKFYGIRVDVDPINEFDFGNMLYFDPLSSLSKVVMYYTNSDTSKSFSFPINTNCIRYNNYDLNYTSVDAEFQKQINNPVPESGNQKLFLQPLVGTRIRVDFEGLDSLRNMKSIALNEVKLYLFVDSYDENLPPPNQIILYTMDKEGTMTVIPDGSSGTSYFGGVFDAQNKRYVFRITRYLQQLLTKPDLNSDPLYISIVGAAYTANRVVLSGNNPTDGIGVKIGVIYTEY